MRLELSRIDAATAVVLSDAARRVREGGLVVSMRLLHIALVVSNFWIGLLGVGRDNLILAVLFITSYHDLQYHAVVWHVGTKRTRAEEERVHPWVRRMFVSTGAFAAAILVGALLQAFFRNDFQLAASVLPASAGSTAVFALVNSYAYMHYYFDGRMWKLSSDPRLRAELGLGSK